MYSFNHIGHNDQVGRAFLYFIPRNDSRISACSKSHIFEMYFIFYCKE